MDVTPPMTLTEEDLAYLLAEQPLMQDETYRELERDFDVWFEEGPWLLLLLLPLAALGFRRGLGLGHRTGVHTTHRRREGFLLG